MQRTYAFSRRAAPSARTKEAGESPAAAALVAAQAAQRALLAALASHRTDAATQRRIEALAGEYAAAMDALRAALPDGGGEEALAADLARLERAHRRIEGAMLRRRLRIEETVRALDRFSARLERSARLLPAREEEARPA